MRTLWYITLLFAFLVIGAECKKKSKKTKTNFQDAAAQVMVNYYYYNRSNRNGIPLTRERLPENYDHNLPSYVVLHGLGSSHNAICQRNIRNAILDRTASNIIVPSYKNTSMLYTIAYQEVARQVGSFLVRGRVAPANTTVIGGSLGAQIAGVMALRSGYRPRNIYGLDPAGPIFEQLPDSQRLSPNSATYVQAIHTNAGVLGAVAPLGNDDVYINGGNDYPCCNSNVCKHSGACDFFVRTIRTGPMEARQCEGVGQARSSSCRGATVPVGYGNSRQPGRRVSHLQLRQCGHGGRKLQNASSNMPSFSDKTEYRSISNLETDSSDYNYSVNNL